MKFKLYILVFLLSTSLFAQKVTTSIDSTRNKIGAEFKLTLKASVDKKAKVTFPEAKNFGPLEVIESYKIDTIKSNDSYELVKKYGLTQFDSGRYVIPKLKIIINGKPIYSDSIKVEVRNVIVDTLKQKMYDIKGIEKVEAESDFWIYLIAVLIVLALLAVGFLWYKKYKNRPKKEEIVYKSPIEKATSLLQSLESKELWQQGEVKEYYSELTDIVRTYIEEEIHIPAMESTTSELIESLKKVAAQKKMKLSPETLKNLEKVLKQADLVKFAKVKPLDFEIEEDKKRITSAVVKIHDAIPVVVEEKDALDLWNEQQRETARLLKLKKEKRKKIIIGVGVLAGILMAIFIFLVATKGIDYVRDNFIGHPTKDLVEGEWITSEYGNPAVKIETPKVLKRMDVEKILPKDAFAILKEMQMFSYGSLTDSFHILVATNKYKKETDVDFDTVLQGITNSWQASGAQNILFKKEEFKTNQGVAGVKAYGTMVVLDKLKNKSQKMYYEILLFKQDGGLQQIEVSHKEDDKYGSELLDRIINSVELQNTQE